MDGIWTQDDIDVLKAALRTGVKRVRYTDREVEYQSLGEMRELLGQMQQDVAAAAGGSSFTLVGTRKGYDS